MSLSGRVTRLERAAEAAEAAGDQSMTVVFAFDPATGGRRVLRAGPPDWRWEELPSDAPVANGPMVRRYGAGMGWDDA